MESTHEARLERARTALDGLSVGDALGERFWGQMPVQVRQQTANADSDDGKWYFTDDTNMALSIYEVLRRYGEIDQDALAASFAQHYEPNRAYGPGAHRLLRQVRDGANWRESAYAAFGGQGSLGNGGAMRAPPVGAYYANDLKRAREAAALSAEVTHPHPEGQAGAIAVAVAAGLACQLRAARERPTTPEFIDMVLRHVPESEVQSRAVHAQRMKGETDMKTIAASVGNGSEVTAMDTVPLVLWAAGQYLTDYTEAILQTLNARGDVDTTCAMVGGIVACYVGRDGIPGAWLKQREPLPNWAFE